MLQVRDRLLAACLTAGVTVRYDAGLRALHQDGAASGSSSNDGSNGSSSGGGGEMSLDQSRSVSQLGSSGSGGSRGKWRCELLRGQPVSCDRVVRPERMRRQCK